MDFNYAMDLTKLGYWYYNGGMMKRRDFIIISLLMLGTLLTVLSCSSKSSVTENKNNIKIVLIGIDGANWPTLDPLIEKGVLPFWKQLKEESAWANLKTFRPTKSSVIWTSIATGKKMEKHGILDFVFLDKNNIKVPFSNVERREPAIWQILNEFNKKCIVINWFVSHPPDDINGIMISDHFRRVVARPPEKINEYIESVKPTIYFHKLIKYMQRDYNQVFKETGLPDYPELYTQLHPDKDFHKVPILQTYRSMAVQDFFVTNISEELYRTKDFDFFATYIRMPDLVQHFSGRMFDDKYTKELVAALKSNSLTKEQKNEVIRKIANIIAPAYKFAEDLLQTLITFKKYQDAYFIIASDHGFSLYPGGYNHYDLPAGYEPPAGILLIKGPGIRPGYLPDATVFDIAPTILNILDLPVGKNMDGKVLHQALKLNRKMKYTVYTLKKKLKRKKSKADAEALKELESLGYIERK